MACSTLSTHTLHDDCVIEAVWLHRDGFPVVSTVAFQRSTTEGDGLERREIYVLSTRQSYLPEPPADSTGKRSCQAGS